MLCKMISLRDYIQSNRPFTVRGGQKDRILIFDIDDTILKSNATVDVYKNDKVVRQLSSSEFNTYKLKPGEQFDFTSFNSAESLITAELLPYWNTLVREYKKGTHVGIITARSDKYAIQKFLLYNNIDIKEPLIIAVNDKHSYYYGNVAERKRQAIEELIHVGYNTFVFFDDNTDNLRYAKSLEKDYDIKVKTIKA